MPAADRRLLFAAYAVLCTAILLAILIFSGGHFAYALDDTYIYLALAENLPGNYSINATGQEAGAPASSILYPYLLMPFMHTSFALYIPLLINLLAGGLVLITLRRLEQQLGLWPSASPAIRTGFVLLMALALNVVTLIFCGMEHTLHLLSALVILSGLIALNEKPATPPTFWFWLAIAIGPLLRYEALALSLLAAFYVGCFGYWRKALLSTVLALAGPLAFGFYLHSLGFSWLPSSVLSKSSVLTAATEGFAPLTLFLQLAANATDNLASNTTAWVHLGLIFMVAFLMLWRQPGPRKRGLLAVVLIASLAHLLLGKFGWWGRYHVYVLALQIGVLAYVAKPLLSRLRVLAIIIVLSAGTASLWYSAQVPAAAGQIYRNHGLLQIFLTNYWKDDSAAYDVGYISWRNPHEVFDLFGLASETVRRTILSPLSPMIIPALLGKEKIDLVIAQDSFADYYWQPQWQRFAELRLDGRRLVTTTRQQFFLLNPARAPELREKLEAFATRLPPDVHLHFYGQ
jgi:hypothetical protein